MPNHLKEGGLHRDPLDRHRHRADMPDPEVLGVSILDKLYEERRKSNGKGKAAAPTSD